MQFFPPIDPDGQRVLTFIAVPALNPNEVFQGGPTVNIKVSAGEDASPSNMFIGPPEYDETGTLILQPVGNLSALDGNDYELEAISATTSPNKTVVIRALLQVRSGPPTGD